MFSRIYEDLKYFQFFVIVIDAIIKLSCYLVITIHFDIAKYLKFYKRILKLAKLKTNDSLYVSIILIKKNLGNFFFTN